MNYSIFDTPHIECNLKNIQKEETQLQTNRSLHVSEAKFRKALWPLPKLLKNSIKYRPRTYGTEKQNCAIRKIWVLGAEPPKPLEFVWAE